jgi:hypothetical protein
MLATDVPPNFTTMRAMLNCLSEIHDKRQAGPRPGRAGSIDKIGDARKNARQMGNLTSCREGTTCPFIRSFL